MLEGKPFDHGSTYWNTVQAAWAQAIHGAISAANSLDAIAKVTVEVVFASGPNLDDAFGHTKADALICGRAYGHTGVSIRAASLEPAAVDTTGR
jgi:hypothetical protein